MTPKWDPKSVSGFAPFSFYVGYAFYPLSAAYHRPLWDPFWVIFWPDCNTRGTLLQSALPLYSERRIVVVKRDVAGWDWFFASLHYHYFYCRKLSFAFLHPYLRSVARFATTRDSWFFPFPLSQGKTELVQVQQQWVTSETESHTSRQNRTDQQCKARLVQVEQPWVTSETESNSS